MAFEGLPGLFETREAFGETTLVVDPGRLVEACMSLRDEHGFEMLIDIAATDYLGWGAPGVSGYIGTAAGRNLNRPMTQGLQALPAPKPKRGAAGKYMGFTTTPIEVEIAPSGPYHIEIVVDPVALNPN